MVAALSIKVNTFQQLLSQFVSSGGKPVSFAVVSLLCCCIVLLVRTASKYVNMLRRSLLARLAGAYMYICARVSAERCLAPAS